MLLLLAALDPATGKKFIIKTFNSFSISDFYLLEAWLIADLLLAGLLEDILKSKYLIKDSFKLSFISVATSAVGFSTNVLQYFGEYFASTMALAAAVSHSSQVGAIKFFFSIFVLSNKFELILILFILFSKSLFSKINHFITFSICIYFTLLKYTSRNILKSLIGKLGFLSPLMKCRAILVMYWKRFHKG